MIEGLVEVFRMGYHQKQAKVLNCLVQEYHNENLSALNKDRTRRAPNRESDTFSAEQSKRVGFLNKSSRGQGNFYIYHQCKIGP